MRSAAPASGRELRASTTPPSYSYALPAPPGFSSASIRPVQAFWSHDLSEYILPYDAVRTARDPSRR
ncbi:MAG: DUF5996 family protein [Methyloceanibacter sp.]